MNSLARHLGSLRSFIASVWRARLLVRSDFYQRPFYSQQLKVAGLPVWTRWFPLFHYLFWGYRQGLNPSPGFDGNWYQTGYPDIKRAGINPLVHFLSAGQFEGRLPRRGAPPAFIDSIPSVNGVAWLEHKLWQGFSHIAAPKLRSAAQRRRQPGASLALAAWAYTDNRIDDALMWLRTSDLDLERPVSVKRLRGLVKAYSQLNRTDELVDLLECPGIRHCLGADAGYAEANGQSDPNKRLAPVNRLLNQRGLVPVVYLQDAGLAGLQPACSPPAMPAGPWPMISVIVPAYNAGPDLALALDSLLQQTWPALEILVVDDASTDDTGHWAQYYAQRDSRVRYFRNNRNLGAYPSRNRGLLEARGDLVTVHDSDDWSHPQKLEVQAKPLLENPGLAATVSHWIRVTSDLSYLGSWMMVNGFVELNPSSWLVRRHWLDRMGGWDNVNVGADSEFARRLEYYLGREALHFLWPDTPLAFARVEAGTLTRTKATHLRTLFYGLRRLYAEASYWWLRQHDELPVMTDNRPFPVPLGNIRDWSQEFDGVVAGNFAQRGKTLNQLINKLTAAVERFDRVCLLHWPDYNAWHTNTIADEIFAFCQSRGLHFAHAGLSVHAKEVVLLEPALWQKPPTETLRIDGLEQVTQWHGGVCEDQAALCAYFHGGGVLQAL